MCEQFAFQFGLLILVPCPHILLDVHLSSTVFGLYRDGTELRGVYPGKPDVARATCEALAPRCDYPILLGMSPF